MMQSQQFLPKPKFKEFSSSFPQNPFFQGLFKCPRSPKVPLKSRAFQGLQGVAGTLATAHTVGKEFHQNV